jgi:hypothetical protein
LRVNPRGCTWGARIEVEKVDNYLHGEGILSVMCLVEQSNRGIPTAGRGEEEGSQVDPGLTTPRLGRLHLARFCNSMAQLKEARRPRSRRENSPWGR